MSSLFDIKKVEDEAQAEIVKERTEKAKNALVKKMRELAAAEDVVRSIKRSIEDLKASIADGSFAG
jgi:hypothetical protein